jgi:hypothetical protein
VIKDVIIHYIDISEAPALPTELDRSKTTPAAFPRYSHGEVVADRFFQVFDGSGLTWAGFDYGKRGSDSSWKQSRHFPQPNAVNESKSARDASWRVGHRGALADDELWTQ